MSKTVIRLGDREYSYWIGHHWLDELVQRIERIGADKYFIDADQNLARSHAGEIQKCMAPTHPTEIVVHGSSEGSKNLATIDRLATQLVEMGATRQSCIVAVGGGMTGNLGGLLAGLLFRGIRLVHVPTTLLAALDSVISIKQAVNGAGAKNTLGMYHAPEMVVTDTEFFATLPASQIRSGLCEVIKNAVAVCPEEIVFLKASLNPACTYDAGFFAELIQRNVKAKMHLICDDPREQQKGLVFEYGHTVGHALEIAAHGSLTHGEAVGLGMLTAVRIGALISSGVSELEVETHRDLLLGIGAYVQIPDNIPVAGVLDNITKDNKRGYLACSREQVPMVLLEAIGRPSSRNGRPLHPVHIRTIEHALEVLV